MQATLFVGVMDESQSFKIFALDRRGNQTKAYIEAQLLGDSLIGTYYFRGREILLHFAEIDKNNPPEFIDGTNTKHDAVRGSRFSRFLNEFSELRLPQNIKYNSASPRLKQFTQLLDKKIQRIGASVPEFALNERQKFLCEVRSGGKIIISDKVVGLLIHVLFDYGFDGKSYESYVYIFDRNGNFIQAFIVYEMNTRFGTAMISTSLSTNKTFIVKDLSEQIKFRIRDDGGLNFRE